MSFFSRYVVLCEEDSLDSHGNRADDSGKSPGSGEWLMRLHRDQSSCRYRSYHARCAFSLRTICRGGLLVQQA